MVRFRVLGERFDVQVDGVSVELRDPSARDLLCVLALKDGARLDAAELDALFGERACAVVEAAGAALADVGWRADRDGCRLDLGPDGYVDLHEFRDLAGQARMVRSADASASVAVYRKALDLWTGRPPRDVPASVRDPLLAELRRVREEIADVQLAAARPAAVIDDVRHWLACDPGHERLRAVLGKALARAGRPGSDAVATGRPAPARIYDYFLGGKDNYAVDRDAAREILAAVPAAADAARANRAFVRRAVRYMAGEGEIRQFLDVGAGLPTRGNVHEIARAERPGARVVYVDNDPVVLTHGRALLEDSAHVAVVSGDLRDPDAIWGRRRLRELIDPGEPVGVLLCGVLHFLPDEDDPFALVERLTAGLPAGSLVAVTHAWFGDLEPGAAERALAVYRRSTAEVRPRTPDEIARFLTGFAPVEPGLVAVTDWRPDTATDRVGCVLGAVGRRV
ncbi:SAM-dependent methyltransferase [Actinomadura rubteroloni]|uniref:SAM-dependent methyltransferase n=1 Tax=Actinomadura rubteroloni TaxID=1926885 RepID=UPI0011AFFFE1|nr:SAM-dependent methyltransferase [Actinomadura rubteroloni]